MERTTAQPDTATAPAAVSEQTILDHWRGIAFTVTGDELVERVAQRVAWHKRRAGISGEELATLPATVGDSAQEYRRDTRRKELDQRVREHEERSAFLDFVREHLDRRRMYKLSAADLRLLEIMPENIHWN